MNRCVFCYPELQSEQNILFRNDFCLFLQLNEALEAGKALEGAGVIVPIQHRDTAFDLTSEEWQATHELLKEVKVYLDQKYQPAGYNLGWNCGELAGQHIAHAHFHVLPRYKDEQLVGKGIRYMFKGGENRRSFR
ncbi:cell-cycle regulation histidine triad protein [Alkalihalobacillus alcalophilus ATCC 27647 = CGMCC 1.3604]|uniref:Cell-cycle regulation histidine triad HIT protein n=1 Tax=Alkalihalobacillus alcalophilus ATCC 27647 = CGMCC 1.3604 TaxID=1218173 RepID=A0A094XBE0_ALKAL|nr:HIT domain-containing protein [Alkalihalobacillus alcalophilus]KGA96125.1 cell-cycle regulation histidine triad HIT protein [Alkalihalobacillus alcalophilus ATCC 27647 = CGMCC 1.3604]MED1564315.1 HIT domain-containing protein [Alkalihalobacillus alcalophilus]THG92076.1 cell-cycle regulation histidine triad protein [Alkalihalobacillus alcalophilus ATCC 27647 = CGMCC 1.3604]